MTIRPFDESRDADYEAVVAIQNAVTPEYATTVAEMKDQESRRDPKCKYGRWLVEVDGVVVGAGGYGQSPWAYHPHRFGVGVTVYPEHEGKGIGSALYKHVLAALESFDPVSVHSNIREDKERALRFALDRGFVEDMREWESRLDVTAFDPAPWKDAFAKPASFGIAIRSYAQLASDPDRDHKLHELISTTFLDVPSTVQLTPPSFEQYETQVLKNPNFLPEGVMIAIDEATGQYVGSSEVWRKKDKDYLNTGLTGVRNEHRRKGIALAMKPNDACYVPLSHKQSADGPSLFAAGLARWPAPGQPGQAGDGERAAGELAVGVVPAQQ